MSVRLDAHNHFTTRSLVLPYRAVVNNVARFLGIGGICGFANFADRRFEAWVDQAPDNTPDFGNAIYDTERGIWVIKGEEVRTRSGDLLILALPHGEPPEHEKPFEYTLEYATDHKGIVIGTELFSRSKIGETLRRRPKLLGKFDAIQVHDAQLLPWQNWASQRFYNDIKDDYPNIGQLSCTDDHFWRPGVSYNTVDAMDPSAIQDSDGVTSALRQRIRQSRDPEKMHKRYAPLRALHHVAAMAYCMTALKVGRRPGDKEAHLPEPERN
ncbi:MAG: hypothetical protein ABIH92_03735 [Nanoarchaeota archaeon]